MSKLIIDRIRSNGVPFYHLSKCGKYASEGDILLTPREAIELRDRLNEMEIPDIDTSEAVAKFYIKLINKGE